MKRTLLILVALLAAGCQYEKFDVRNVEAPFGGDMTTERASVPVGALVRADVTALSKGGAALATGGYVRSANRNVLEVRLQAGETQRFVLLGVSAGTTTLDFMAEDKVQFSVPATVYEP